MSDTEIGLEHNPNLRKIKSPEEKAAEAARKRNRYNSDPEYRQKYLDKLKAWRQNNPDKLKEYINRWKSNHPNWRQEYRNKNRQKIRDINSRYIKLHPEIKTRNSAVRRARINALDVHVTNNDLYDLMVWQQGLCFYCGAKLTDKNKTLEHVVPISKGGTNRAENCRWACEECNEYKKREYLLDLEWMPESPEWSLLNYSCNNFIQKILDDISGGSIIENYKMKIISYNNYKVTILSSFAFCSDYSLSLEDLRKNYPELNIFWDWEFKTRPQAIIQSIKAKAGLAGRIHARKCKVSTISKESAKEFLNLWHIQGFARASEHLGLILNNEIQAVLSVTNSHIVRFCCKNSIPGALSKFLAHNEFQYPLTTYCEPRYGSGEGYLRAGFTQLPDSESVSYGYMQGPKYIPRTSAQKQNIEKILDLFFPELTEEKNAAINGLRRLNGLQQHKFILY